MSGFPVNLDLSEYFEDLRKYSSVFVNLSKCKTVGDVEGHIKSVFGLEENISLVHKKFLIPKSEDIQILQQYDIFKVLKCNFYDAQIHKAKKENAISTGDQKALNLTQSEKTIDLSCRPKQRLKGNVCTTPCLSGTPSLSTDSRGCKTYVVSPNLNIITNGNHNVKEKSKHKKKRCTTDSDSDDDEENILDMSVKNSKRKKHSNCFSTDDASLFSDCVNDINPYQCLDIAKDHPKKPKKKKKHLEETDEPSLNLSSPYRESFVNSDSSNKEHFCKKKHKKSRGDPSNSCLSDFILGASTIIEPNNTEAVGSNHSLDESLVRKKHKHSKRSHESKSYNDSPKDQYSSFSSFTFKDINSNKATNQKTHFDPNKCNSISEPSNALEEAKKKIELEVDKMIANSNESSMDTGFSTKDNENDVKSKDLSFELSRSNGNIKEGNDDEQNSIPDNILGESHSNGDFKRKRKRKHNKKKKKETLMHMSAIGPILSQLSIEPPIAKSSPRSECAKHVYFTEEDFDEEMDVPSTPHQTSQIESSQPSNRKNEVPLEEEQQSNSQTWKENLLRLASCTKPVVFHRSTNASTSDKQTPQDHQPSLHKDPTDNKRSDAQERPVAEVQSCSREVNDGNNGEDRCSATETSQTTKNGIPNIQKPLPRPDSLKDINLSNYPIIDKVVPEDFILFKIWKFNEQGEAGLSKPILAKVDETTSFPHKISLHIMEGSDECSHCVPVDGKDAYIIDLQWTDINEPRLFYP